MGSKSKKVAPQGAASEAVKADVLADSSATPITDLLVKKADADETDKAGLDIEAGEGDAGDNGASNPDLAPPVVEEKLPSVWPSLYQVTNCTRMPLHLPAAGLRVAPFGGEDDVLIKSQDHINGIQAELAALQKLNGFAADAFTLEPVGE